MNQLSCPTSVKEVIEEYHEKSQRLADEIKAFEQAERDMDSAVQVIGGFTGDRFIKKNYLLENHGQRILLASTWKSIYHRLGLDNVFSADDKRKFEQSLMDPPAMTLDNLESTFGKYWSNPRYYILKGLAEAFCKLDKFYKSHSNFGFGVKGLPKRAIIRNFAGYGSWGSDHLKDMCEAMLQVTGSATLTQDEKDLIYQSKLRSEDFELPRLGLSIRTFQNGNAHVYFDKQSLRIVSDALHEFYGDVLPDAQDKGGRPKSTEVAKDLQFYRTPKDVVERVLDSINIPKGAKVLEPSCGDGAILDALRERGARCTGIEVDTGRAMDARSKGHAVHIANFLDTSPQQLYDFVVMNPPFYGKHYVKHIEHAKKYLKDGGKLVSILPATAWYEHKLVKGQWQDLPIGSFKESGTNVNTGFIIMRSPLNE